MLFPDGIKYDLSCYNCPNYTELTKLFFHFSPVFAALHLDLGPACCLINISITSQLINLIDIRSYKGVSYIRVTYIPVLTALQTTLQCYEAI